MMPQATIPAPPNRAVHGRALQETYEQAIAEAAKRRAKTGMQVQGAVPGIYVQFESQPGIPLNLSSLEHRTKGIELIAVTHATSTASPAPPVERATVFVPEGKVKHFISRFESYAKTEPKVKSENRYEDMLDRVATLRLATLRALWTDDDIIYPKEDQAIWWEVWLRRTDGHELARLMEYADHVDLHISKRRLAFDDRVVTLIYATPRQLAGSLDVLHDLAEVRAAKETAGGFEDMNPAEQGEWAKELLTRTKAPSAESPAVCVLDTGVNGGHPLLETAISASDCHACEPGWGIHDHDGHGTEMAGLALYGDLTPVLAESMPVHLFHRLESVKILPPKGKNPPDLYGTLTAYATSLVEINAPARRRCFSMAVSTTDSRDRGQPTSWSAAVDALAAGRAFDRSSQGLVYLDEDEPHRRLFVLCAGNVNEDTFQVDHLARSDVEAVHDPGQAWNALTVGAFTEKARIVDSKWQGWLPLARAGELSPYSSTGRIFQSKWPFKPDVVFEGGNIVKNEKDELDFPCPDLCLLSTHYRPAENSLVHSYATSAATAQVARLAAIISSEYPALWPETIRALIVHSARWTPTMQAHFDQVGDKKTARARLVSRYGFGVPSLERATRSASNSLTLIAQSSIRPFDDGTMREMHLFELPWPKEILHDLGETAVQVRVTLSYFVEPNPSRRGWTNRYRYASHGLRFDIKGPTETVEIFRKRLNQKALDPEEDKPLRPGDVANWYLGQARNRGSIHSDILEDTAANIADRGVIAVYPVSGWWKDQPKRDRSEKGARYALLISIEAPNVDADIWTPIAQQVGISTSIEI